MPLQVADLLQDIISYVRASPIAAVLFTVVYMTAVLYLLWRCWTFTVLPILRPQDPPELPYSVPVLGHAFSFIKDAQALVTYGKTYFGNSPDPFTIMVGGEKLYIVTTPADVGAIYRNNTTLSWDAMLDDLLVDFGVNADVIPKVWQKFDSGFIGAERLDAATRGLSPIHSVLNNYKRQLLPGEKLNKFSKTLLAHIDAALCWNNLSQRGVPMSHFSLKDFCAEILVDAISRTMFGDHILDVEPGLVQNLLDFNDDAWMLVFHCPQPAASKLNKARSKILKGFVRYIQGPDETRSGRAWLIERVMEELKAVDIRDEDRAALLLMTYWAANINPYRLAFWMLTYILFDPELLAALRAETSLAYQDGNMNLSQLLDGCPRLDAAYQETLRVVSGTLSARKIVAPTPMGSKILRSGNTILIPFRQLHYNKDVFGNNPGHFDPERFLKQQNLRNSSSFKPFGGGVNYCPGRFLARQEMLVFVALVLNRFDVELATYGLQDGSLTRPQSFPKLDESTPALGVNGPVKGSDVYVNFRKREY